MIRVRQRRRRFCKDQNLITKTRFWIITVFIETLSFLYIFPKSESEAVLLKQSSTGNRSGTKKRKGPCNVSV